MLVHAAEAESSKLLGREGTRFPPVVLAAVLKPNLQRLEKSWLPNGSSPGSRVDLDSGRHTCTSFSLSETRSTIS
jgi:hypothetical protein